MTRPRPTSPGRTDPVRLRSISPLPLIVVLAVFGGCIGGGSGTPAATPANVASASPSISSEPSAIEPSPSASPAGAATPSPIPGETESASPSPASVEACTGTDDNRSFFADAAANLDWPVYCPALPARWFVSTGSYSGVGQGRVAISYKGPSGATLSLHEGAFCDDGDGCVAAGTDAGDATFGDRTGTLVVLDDGGYAIVVDRGAHPSWLAIATGLDEEAFRQIAAAFVRLD